MMSLETYVSKKLIDIAFNAAKGVLKNKGGGIQSSEKRLEESIGEHLNWVKNWSSEVSFSDLKRAKSTDDIYIPLDLYVTPLRTRIVDGEEVDSCSLRKAVDFSRQSNFVILGYPGAGKTTTMKHLCQNILLGDDKIFPQCNFPIVVRLRDINKIQSNQLPDPSLKDDILWSILHRILGVQISYPNELLGDENKLNRSNVRKSIIVEILEKLCPLIVFEGFDEIQFKTHRDTILGEIRELGVTLNKAQMVLTSRTGEFNYSVDGFDHFEIRPLNNIQIEKFVRKWLDDKDSVNGFLKQLRVSPFKDTAIRPLTISHLCAIFERIGRIPEKPKTVYKKVVNLLIEDWDEQRSITRETVYSNFEADRKFEFLAYLAFVLTSITRKTVFNGNDLKNGYERICDNFGLPARESVKVARELESHTGLFLESGFESYEFTHKSIQEYLSSEYLVRLAVIPKNESVFFHLANEFAIATAISSNPSHYLIELIFSRIMKFKSPSKTQFISTYVNRLLEEKPDFHRSKSVGWALIVLYSMHFGAYIDSPQRELFLGDNLTRQFDELAGMINDRISVSVIRAGYDQIDVQPTTEGITVITMKKREHYFKQHIEGNEEIISDSLPEVIRINSSLVGEVV